MYSPFPSLWYTTQLLTTSTELHPPLFNMLSPSITISHTSLSLSPSIISLSLSRTLALSVPGFIRRQVSEVWIHTRHENVMPLFSLHSPCLVNCRLGESGRWLRAQVCVFVRVMHTFAWFGSESNENGRKCRGDVWRYIQSICVSSLRVVPCVSYHDLYTTLWTCRSSCKSTLLTPVQTISP